MPGESHGQRILVGYSPGTCKESAMTELLNSSSKSNDKYPYKRKAEGDLRERERREPQKKRGGRVEMLTVFRIWGDSQGILTAEVRRGKE